MRYTTAKTVRFEASHQLEGLPPGHKCSRPHGHGYQATIYLSGETLEDGFLVDAGLVSTLVKELFDHQNLNEVLGKGVNPTAENIARVIMQSVDDLLFRIGSEDSVACTKVVLRETETFSATVEK